MRGKGLFLLFRVSHAGVPLWGLGAIDCCADVGRGPPQERLVTCSLRNRGQA